MDFLIAGYSPGRTTWYENDGNQVFTEPEIGTATVTAFITAYDFDGDGDLDVVSNCKNELLLYTNDGSMGFTESIIASADNGRGIVHTDLNQDGYEDIVFASKGDDKVYWGKNDGSASFTIYEIADDIYRQSSECICYRY